MNDSPAPQVSTPPARLNELRGAISIVPRAAIALGALCYGLGLLIVTSRLAELGVYTTDFLRTEYVLAGAAFCVLTCCAAIAVHYFAVFLWDSVNLWKQKKYLGAAFELLLTLAASLSSFSVVLGVISANTLGPFPNWRTWVTLAVTLGFYGAARTIFDIARNDWIGAIGHRTDRERMRHVWKAAANVGFLIIVLSMYASFVYPHVLSQYGGGHRHSVLLIPTKTGERVGRISGLPFQPDGSIGPVQLLLENAQDLTVATTDDSRAVTIARNLVEAVTEYKATKMDSVSAKVAKKRAAHSKKLGGNGKPGLK